MSQPFPYQPLGPYLPEIRRLRPARQAIPFCPNHWNTPTLRPHLRPLLNAFPELTAGIVTRRQVHRAGVLAVNGQLPWNSFFLACMVWGYGTVGYGPYRTERMFLTPGRVAILTRIRNAVRRGDLPTAYREAHIDYCGPPFFTKFFYFLGLAFESRPRPLILDSRVSNSLSRCGGDRFDARVYFRQKGAARFPIGYCDYVADLNRWGRENNFEPDQLELFLFCPPVGF